MRDHRNWLVIGGFSDGASYALSLNLANGDVFSYIVAFSPGFIVRAQARGRMGNDNKVRIPLVYIAHGTGDNVLPITSTSRIFVSSLRKNGYNVEFREFNGGHHLSRQVVDQAMTWLTAAFQQHRWSSRGVSPFFLHCASLLSGRIADQDAAPDHPAKQKCGSRDLRCPCQDAPLTSPDSHWSPSEADAR